MFSRSPDGIVFATAAPGSIPVESVNPNRRREHGLRRPSFLAMTMLLATLAAMPVCRAEAPVEVWEVAKVLGVRVGFVRTETAIVKSGAQDVVRVRETSRQRMKRFRDAFMNETQVDSFEFPDGLLYSMRVSARLAQNEMTWNGLLGDDGTFKVSLKTAANTANDTIPWGKDVLGPAGQERLLKELLAKPGEPKTFRTLPPLTSKVVTGKLTAGAKETLTPPAAPPVEVTRVELAWTGNELPGMSYWVDAKGQVWRRRMTIGRGLVTDLERTTKEEALKEPDGAVQLDLGEATVVKPNRPIDGAHRLATARYRLRFTNPEAAKAIVTTTSQNVVERQPLELIVELGPNVGGAEMAPDLADQLAANAFITPNDAAITAEAKRMVDAGGTLLEKARRMERWVKENMTSVDFTVGFADAAEVMKTRRGDCTEHAVLLASLLRAGGIPARVAIGMVYVDRGPESVFGYHMWTEAVIDGKWVSLDGTLGLGGIGAGHLKIADASLKGTGAIEAFEPIFRVLGSMTIEVLEPK
jgi:transglutaminase-like putative cysteine protease